ncbi:bifunctional WD40-repeat-containing domain superfamily/WD40 repeat/Pre-mRNA 3' end processing protein Pfs2-like/WD40-YVTN repeat-like-containing domain superfamily [Babesia duncani]|uniref:Bifunctional WD40-repeat-containing domain superfamily/WD40 repeat/Pre-mRNA 3' end processing protein Pfs2-like/WD40-YVTN repeat-like-containing domain superfamily n=1 Tax=Babesia duncani TaxID=323732 RepID=A0AAD9PMV3_9APIC|nr:bifunctional WD40-repeat-containing domain superfamily/WD40 repeat/Pre-mRNA 3' end processing protein Pfs2-like/WD40-YVTN repeat-like-containing domain superfamily [Babesia duncani]
MGIDRAAIDYSSHMIPWLLKTKYQKTPKVPRHRDCPLDYNRVEPVVSYAHFTNQYNGVCNFLAHAAFNRNKYPNLSLRWFPNGKTLLGGSQGGKLIMWNGTTFQFEDIKRFPVSSGSVTAMQWSPDGDFLVAGDEHGKLGLLSPALSLLDAKLFEGLYRPVLDLSLSPNGSKLVACADTYSPHVFDVQHRSLEGTLSGEHIDSTSVSSLDWHPFKSLICTGTRTNITSLWDPLSRRQISTMHVHKAPLCKVSWNPQGNTWLTASVDGIINLWDLRVLKPLIMYRLSSVPTCIAWNPIFPSVFAVGDNKSRLLHFTSDFEQPVSEITTSCPPAKDTSILSMDWHPQGHCLATCSDDKVVRFWCRSPPGSPNHTVNVSNHGPDAPEYLSPYPLGRFHFQSEIGDVVSTLPCVVDR